MSYFPACWTFSLPARSLELHAGTASSAFCPACPDPLATVSLCLLAHAAASARPAHVGRSLRRTALPCPEGHRGSGRAGAGAGGAGWGVLCRAFWEHLWAAVARTTSAPSLASRVGPLAVDRKGDQAHRVADGLGRADRLGVGGWDRSSRQQEQLRAGWENHPRGQHGGGVPSPHAEHRRARRQGDFHHAPWPHGLGHLGVGGSWPSHAYRWGASGAGSQVPLQGQAHTCPQTSRWPQSQTQGVPTTAGSRTGPGPSLPVWPPHVRMWQGRCVLRTQLP